MFRPTLYRSIVVALAFSSAAVFAGGPDNTQTPYDASRQGMYVDLNLGYAFSNWASFTKDNHGGFAFLGITPHNNRKGGFTYGGDLGYQFSPYLGLEFGAFSLPEVKSNQFYVTTPYYYGAAKVTVPIYKSFVAIGKLGGAYRPIKYNGSARRYPYNDVGHQAKFLYGAGLQYYVTKNFSVSTQWLAMLKTTKGSNRKGDSAQQVPTMNQVFLGLGYLFAV